MSAEALALMRRSYRREGALCLPASRLSGVVLVHMVRSTARHSGAVSRHGAPLRQTYRYGTRSPPHGTSTW